MRLLDLIEMVPIKLKGFSAPRRGDTEGFMEAYFEMTEENWMNPNVRMYGGITLDVSPFGSEIHIGDISANGDAGTGQGTTALKMLTGLADEFMVTLSGTAKAYSERGDHIQDSERLAQWYQKHGFKVTGGDAQNGFEISYEGR